jgi:hypothetical protein
MLKRTFPVLLAVILCLGLLTPVYASDVTATAAQSPPWDFYVLDSGNGELKFVLSEPLDGAPEGGYVIVNDETGDEWEIPPSEIEFLLEGFQGNVYAFFITAVAADGTESERVPATVFDLTITPQNFEVAYYDGGDLWFMWDEPAGGAPEGGYVIVNDETWDEWEIPPSETEFFVEGFQGNVFAFFILSVAADGTRSAWTQVTAIDQTNKPNPPTNFFAYLLEIDGEIAQVTFSWDEPEGVPLSFYIVRNGEEMNDYVEIDAPCTGFTSRDYTFDTDAFYISAYNANGVGSGWTKAILLPEVQPVQNLTAAYTDGSVQFTWDEPAPLYEGRFGVSNYIISWGIADNFDETYETILTSAPNDQYNATGLQTDTTYQFEISPMTKINADYSYAARTTVIVTTTTGSAVIINPVPDPIPDDPTPDDPTPPDPTPSKPTPSTPVYTPPASSPSSSTSRPQPKPPVSSVDASASPSQGSSAPSSAPSRNTTNNTLNGAGLNATVNNISTAEAGETVVLTANNSKGVPGAIFEAAKESGAVLEINTNGFTWSIDGASVSGEVDEQVNLKVTRTLNRNLLRLARGKNVMQLNLAQDGEFPFEGSLTVGIRDKYIGQTIFIYPYDAETNSLGTAQEVTVTEDGQFTFDVTEGGLYLVASAPVDAADSIR